MWSEPGSIIQAEPSGCTVLKSEPGSVIQAELSGCTVLKVVVYISLRSLLSLEEESGESGT